MRDEPIADETKGRTRVEHAYEQDVEALFVEDDGWIAALARQVFRAREAEDSVAEQVTFFYLENFLIKVLQRHLMYRDPLWERRLDGRARWLDGLDVTRTLPALGRLTLRGQVDWAIGQHVWYYDPFEFELQLCPGSGGFQGYVYRFGDHRPLEAKQTKIDEKTDRSPVGGWQHEIHHGLPVE